MANNRMYLKCSCGELFYLGKRMGDGYYLGYGIGQRLPEIGPFFDAHEWCPGGLDHFSVAYESERNYDHFLSTNCGFEAVVPWSSGDINGRCNLPSGHGGDHNLVIADRTRQ